MRRSFLLAFLLARLLASAAQQTPYCQTLTKITGCVECSGSPSSCYFCNYRTSPIWTTPGPKLTECRALSLGTACRGTTLIGSATRNALFGKYCDACETTLNNKFPANRCVRCLPNYGMDSSKKCNVLLGTATTGLAACRASSMNAGCAECNPDGTCRRCSAGAVLMPAAAVWLDAGYPETQCMATTSIQTEAKKVVGTVGNVVASCAETDLDFNCVACSQATSTNTLGWGPKVDPADATGKKITCVKNVGTAAAPVGAASGCLMKTPYMQYCKKCDATKAKCLTCMYGRSLDASGRCSLNCRGMFGISCKACTATACTALDVTFKSGR